MNESLLGRVWQLLRQYFGSDDEHGPWEDSSRGVRVPRGAAPGSRGAAAAVVEPEPELMVAAIGRGPDHSPGMGDRE